MNQPISKCTKIFPNFLIELGWSLKKTSSPKFNARIISNLHEFISCGERGKCKNLTGKGKDVTPNSVVSNDFMCMFGRVEQSSFEELMRMMAGLIN